MTDVVRPAGNGRRSVLRVVLGAGIMAALAARASRAADGDHVTISNFAFTPKTLTVKAGTEVTWTNKDQMVHTIVCPALKLKSDPLDTDDSYRFVFHTAGTYEYVCSLHPYMRGRVVVTA